MSNVQRADVAIVGAGPAGIAAAIGFALRRFSTAIVDTSVFASSGAARGRSAALLKSTIAFLDRLGVWKECSERAAPLKALQFVDDTGRLFRAPDCSFSASEIGEEAFGYNIANADLMLILMRQANQLGLRVLSLGAMRNMVVEEGLTLIGFENGAKIAAELTIGADGRASASRKAAGIRTATWTYDQMAVATSFGHERPHNGVCIELHRSAGPFTLIPLPGNRSSLVWVERKNEAERLLALDPQSFCRAVREVSHFALGDVFDVTERAGFPLSSLLAREFGKNRVALIGEAAHVTPPIGAQGLNMGFRDVEALLDLVDGARRRQEDIGGENLLRAYSAVRRSDVLGRTLGIDLLNRSLLSAFLPFQLARGAGLYALSSIGPLRRAFMRRGIAPSETLAP